MQEADAWKELVEKRDRCLVVVRAMAPDTVDDVLLHEIANVEKVASDLWQRLEANSRKARKSTSVVEGSLAQRWAHEVVIPLAVAWQLCTNEEAET